MAQATREAHKSLMQLQSQISQQEQTVEALRAVGHEHSDALRHLKEMKDSISLLRGSI